MAVYASLQELKNAITDSVYQNNAGLVTADIVSSRMLDTIDTLNAFSASIDNVEEYLQANNDLEQIIIGTSKVATEGWVEQYHAPVDHNHDDLYVKIGEGGTTDISEWFEIVNEGLENEYLRLKKPMAGDFEISAWSDSGWLPPDIWDSMPLASINDKGAIQYFDAHFTTDSGIFKIKPGVLIPASHTHAWSDITSGIPEEFTPSTHGSDKHSVTYLTAIETPLENQVAIWDTASTLKGSAGITYDGTTFTIDGNIVATGEISAFTAEDPGGTWWDYMPHASTTILGGVKVGANLTIDGNGVLNAAGGTGGDGVWGSITGDIGDQTDLQTALGLLAPIASPTFTGIVTTGSIISVGPDNYGNFTARKNANVGNNCWYEPGGGWKSLGSTADYGFAVLMSTAGHPQTNPYAIEVYVDTAISGANEDIDWVNIFNIGKTGIVYALSGNSTEWNTAYTDRMKWDGGSTGLVAATGRTSLGLGTAAQAASGDFLAYNAQAVDSDKLDGQHGSYYATQGQSFYLGTTAIAINRGSGALALAGITGIDGTAASTPKLLTTNFSIEESGGKLVIKYGATVIGSISSAGYLKMKDESEAFSPDL